MKVVPPLLLPLLRSPIQGELLSWLFLHPEAEFSATDLAAKLGTSQPTVSREADRLVQADLVRERRHGNLRLLRANPDTIVARPLTDLLAVTYGPVAVLGGLLARIAGIDEAFIYGSWAARYHNEPGPIPRDVDVLVIGVADDDELYEAARAAERVLGREVNIQRISPTTWSADAEDPLLMSIRNNPVVRIQMSPF